VIVAIVVINIVAAQNIQLFATCHSVDTTQQPVPNHFRATGGEREDLRMAPVMRVKTNNPWVRLHLERLFINKHNLVEDGINNVL